jgi:hypothetical protein
MGCINGLLVLALIGKVTEFFIHYTNIGPQKTSPPGGLRVEWKSPPTVKLPQLTKVRIMTISESQLITMLEFQDGMNSKVNPDWLATNNNWHRAIRNLHQDFGWTRGQRTLGRDAYGG